MAIVLVSICRIRSRVTVDLSATRPPQSACQVRRSPASSPDPVRGTLPTLRVHGAAVCVPLDLHQSLHRVAVDAPVDMREQSAGGDAGGGTGEAASQQTMTSSLSSSMSSTMSGRVVLR